MIEFYYDPVMGLTGWKFLPLETVKVRSFTPNSIKASPKRGVNKIGRQARNRETKNLWVKVLKTVKK